MQYRWMHRGPHSVWTDVWIWQMLQRSVRGGGLQTHRWQQTTAPLAGGSWTRQAAWTGFWIIQHKLTPSPTAPAAVHHEECHPPFFFSSVIYSPGNKTLPNVLESLLWIPPVSQMKHPFSSSWIMKGNCYIFLLNTAENAISVQRLEHMWQEEINC